MKLPWRCITNVTRRLLPFVPMLVLSVIGTSGRLSAAGDFREEAEGSFALSSIDVPGAVFTEGEGINDRGDIVGLYTSNDGVTHGFLLKDGNFTSINYPGAAYTDARGINAQGDIVGTYHLPSENSDPLAFHGYVLSRKGQFSRIDFPGHPNTISQRITSTGIVVGCYHDHDFMMSMHGFVMDRNGFSGFSVPVSMHNGATPDGSVFAGLFADSTGAHGYLVKDGQFQPFDVPGSISTAAWDLNPEGDTVGQYRDSSGIHGFVRNAEGQFTFPIDFPGSKNTQARGINARGDVVGWYVDSAGKFHGFLAELRDGNGGKNEQ